MIRPIVKIFSKMLGCRPLLLVVVELFWSVSIALSQPWEHTTVSGQSFAPLTLAFSLEEYVGAFTSAEYCVKNTDNAPNDLPRKLCELNSECSWVRREGFESEDQWHTAVKAELDRLVMSREVGVWVLEAHPDMDLRHPTITASAERLGLALDTIVVSASTKARYLVVSGTPNAIFMLHKKLGFLTVTSLPPALKVHPTLAAAHPQTTMGKKRGEEEKETKGSAEGGAEGGVGVEGEERVHGLQVTLHVPSHLKTVSSPQEAWKQQQQQQQQDSGDVHPQAAAWSARVASSLGHTHARVQAADAKTGAVSIEGLNRRDAATAAMELAQRGNVLWVMPRARYKALNHRAKGIVQTGSVGGATPLYDMGIRGEDQIVGVSDGGIDLNHCFFHDENEPIGINGKLPTGTVWESETHRKLVQYVAFADGVGELHGTHVCGSINGGLANGEAQEAGLAEAAKVAFYDVAIDDKEYMTFPPSLHDHVFSAAYKAGARIHSNSWGAFVPWYTEDARQLDLFSWEHQDFLILIAAGNEGLETVTDGDDDYAGHPGNIMGLLTVGSPATSKNCVAVGASRETRGVADLTSWSSRGPVVDGRIKPDIIAPGFIISASTDAGSSSYVQCDVDELAGTSMATPVAAASAALIRQYFMQGFQADGATRDDSAGFTPMGALVKAVLVNGGRALTGPQSSRVSGETSLPNIDQGWGSITLANTLKTPQSPPGFQLYTHGAWSDRCGACPKISEGDAFEYTVVTDGSVNGSLPLKITMVYFDYHSTPFADYVVVNDVDLTVTDPTGATIFANNRDGLDDLNQVEHIVIPSPTPASTYTVTITGTSIPMGPQPYALVISGAYESIQDSDLDGDGVLVSPGGGGGDNCPFVSNPGQEDADGNGVGNACEPVVSSLCDAEFLSYLGDGVCDQRFGSEYNTEACGWDGGDCCVESCKALDDPLLVRMCGIYGYECLDPALSATTPPSDPDQLICEWEGKLQMGDGFCNEVSNTYACLWDGGDCCMETHEGIYYSYFNCKNPALIYFPECELTAEEEILKLGNGVCDQPPPTAGRGGGIWGGGDPAGTNTEACGWDGGDCCEGTCLDGSSACGSGGYHCLNPLADCPLDEEFWDLIGDGMCNAAAAINQHLCGWDGGDCCEETCEDGEYDCGSVGFQCLLEYPACTHIHPSLFPQLGDGYCNSELGLNVEECGFDGGDCCEGSCVGVNGGTALEERCGANGYVCLDPAHTECALEGEDRMRLGDGVCDGGEEGYNTEACGWDGGDCCESTCKSGEGRWDLCGSNGYTCLSKPDATCGGGGCYARPFDDGMMWSSAETACGDLGADWSLGCPMSQEQNDVAVAIASSTNQTLWTGYVWRDGEGGGGYRCFSENVTAPAMTNFTNWESGTPPPASTGEECVVVTGEGWWELAPCNSTIPQPLCAIKETDFDPCLARVGASYLSKLGDGYCNHALGLNSAECDWDGGDCCEETCTVIEPSLVENCGDFGYACLDPTLSTCEIDPSLHPKLGDGHCNHALGLNVEGCGWDGGDCCEETCTVIEPSLVENCGDFGYACLNPTLSTCEIDPSLHPKLGDGHCNHALGLNVESCDWDGGDCCEETCAEFNPSFAPNCGESGYVCLDSEHTTCEIDPGLFPKLGDGYCNNALGLNSADCDWDGGDCCEETCTVIEPSLVENCGDLGYACLDPTLSTCEIDPSLHPKLGDGHCNHALGLNVEECGWDGGDCCVETCYGIDPSLQAQCGKFGYVCLDPEHQSCEIDPSLFPQLGDGYCNSALGLNVEACGFDGGDCCVETCSGSDTVRGMHCGSFGYSCVDPFHSECEIDVSLHPKLGDGICNHMAGLNVEACGWDGGDCCAQTCFGIDPAFADQCGSAGYVCNRPVFSTCDLNPDLQLNVGDGYCNNVQGMNVEACGWDGGDCCAETCTGSGDSPRSELCGDFGYACLNPTLSTCEIDPSLHPKLGDGHCNHALGLNVESCDWDGGDCCEETCDEDPLLGACGTYGYVCLDSAHSACEIDPGLSPKLGDGYCNNALGLNTAECDWDGGDCCEETCTVIEPSLEENCGDFGYTCLDPAHTECAVVVGGNMTKLGDGVCDGGGGGYNTEACGWDGGDCCEGTCADEADCGSNGYDCLAPQPEVSCGGGVCFAQGFEQSLTWEAAVEFCAGLGEGWSLGCPTSTSQNAAAAAATTASSILDSPDGDSAEELLWWTGVVGQTGEGGGEVYGCFSDDTTDDPVAGPYANWEEGGDPPGDGGDGDMCVAMDGEGYWNLVSCGSANQRPLCARDAEDSGRSKDDDDDDDDYVFIIIACLVVLGVVVFCLMVKSHYEERRARLLGVGGGGTPVSGGSFRRRMFGDGAGLSTWRPSQPAKNGDSSAPPPPAASRFASPTENVL